MTEEEKLERKLDNANKSTKNAKKDDTMSKLWEISLATMILTGFILLMLIIPIVLFYVLIGDLFVGYDRIYLNYIYPVFEFLKKDAPLIGFFCLTGAIVGYLLIFHAMISMILRKQTPSDNKIVMIIGCIGLIIIYCVLYGFANNKLSSKETLASVKLKHVQSLIGDLVVRTQELSVMNDDLADKIKKSEDELHRLRVASKLYDLDEARKDQKIINELNAIEKAQTYKNFVIDHWNLTSANIDIMDGRRKLYELDIIVLAGLNEEQLQSLIDEMDVIIESIEPYANELVVNKNAKRIPLEEIWEKHTRPIQLEPERRH